jgi:hypothetical protein
MKLEFSRQIFEESSNIKFRENPSGGSRDVPCGGMDRGRHDEASSRFSLFCKRALKKSSPPAVRLLEIVMLKLVNFTYL